MTSPRSQSINHGLIDEEGEEVTITKQTVIDGLRRAVEEARSAREIARRPVPIEELRRAAAAAGAAAEAAAYWWDVTHDGVVIDADADLRERADWRLAEVQDALAAVLDVLAHVEGILAAQDEEDEAALAEREREVENLAVLAEGAVLDEAAFLAAAREGRLTTAQWAVMALRVGSGQASPEVVALVEREASSAAQWAFLLR